MAKLSDPYSWAGKVNYSGGKLSPAKQTNPYDQKPASRAQPTPGKDLRPEAKGRKGGTSDGN